MKLTFVIGRVNICRRGIL